MFLVVYDDAENPVYLKDSGYSWTPHREKAHKFEDKDTAWASAVHWRHFGKTELVYLEVL